MGSAAKIIPSNPAAVHSGAHSLRPIYMVLGCTVFAAVAQVLLKFGALHPKPHVDWTDLASIVVFIKALIGNVPLMVGYTLHGCNAALLILALREGHLSVLYPILALSYIWVDLLSLYYFNEHMNVWKVAGIVLIISGVALLGRVSTRS